MADISKQYPAGQELAHGYPAGKELAIGGQTGGLPEVPGQEKATKKNGDLAHG